MTDFRATSTVKIFVGNLSKSTSNEKIRELFETYGAVAEADVLGEFGFVVSYYLGPYNTYTYSSQSSSGRVRALAILLQEIL